MESLAFLLLPLAAFAGAFFGARYAYMPAPSVRRALRRIRSGGPQQEEVSEGAIPDLTPDALNEWWNGERKADHGG